MIVSIPYTKKKKIKSFLDNKMSNFEEYGAFKFKGIITVTIAPDRRGIRKIFLISSQNIYCSYSLEAPYKALLMSTTAYAFMEK